MSGVHRLLTRRDKKHRDKSHTDHGELGPVFILEDTKKKSAKEDDKKIKAILGRLQRYGITDISEANIEYTLHAASTPGDSEDAFKLCLLLQDTYEGLLKPYNPGIRLLGAVNRDSVTCYLDALLFAMFARLDSFEAMLYNSFEDATRKKLAGLLRLWVNMLRTGRLITTDITKQLQNSLSECGWEAAGRLQQQDTSEAFTFITGKLELPLLTLKMDMYHIGKDEPDDDHKFVNERVLDVAILAAPPEGSNVVTLEDCLEHYFNNRVDVNRPLEQRRRESLRRTESIDMTKSTEKTSTLHVETVDLGDGPDTPLAESPTPAAPMPAAKGPIEQMRPLHMRSRADSIFSQRRARPLLPDAAGPSEGEDTASISTERQRQASIKTEVSMPAWQFFKLLPWYTDNVPTSDVQVAAHFARKRPVLGICLKRYTMTNDGKAQRLDTFVDIPLEIAVPDFVSDDNIGEGSPLVGNFKLVLQSVVCHRGRSVHSGHYIALVRGTAPNASSQTDLSRQNSASDDEEEPWMLFDDLAKERVTFVNIEKALKDECPYLLFYQVQPIEVEEAFTAGPPSYNEAISRSNSDQVDYLPEKFALPDYSDSDVALVSSNSATSPTDPGQSTDAVDWAPSVPASERTSMDAGTMLDSGARGRLSTSSGTRGSIIFEDSVTDMSSVRTGGTHSGGNTPGATTPHDESRTSFLNLPTRRTSRQSATSRKTKSRPTSQGPDTTNRFSLNMSKLTNRLSRADPPNLGTSTSTSRVTSQSLASTSAEKADATSGSEASLEALEARRDSNVGEKVGNTITDKDKERIFKQSDKAAAKEQGSSEGDQPGHGGHHHHQHHHHHGLTKKGKKGQVPDRDCIVM